MGFPSDRGKTPSFRHTQPQIRVDWTALEEHLRLHPEEAKIVNPTMYEKEFPLEAALKFEFPTPIPFSTVQLLLQLCPEAIATNESPCLYLACQSVRQQDPRVVQAILNANIALASCIPPCLDGNDRAGLPITYAIHLPCASQVIPDLVRANPQSLVIGNIVGDTPLFIATHCRRPPIEVVRALLEEGLRYQVRRQALHIGEYKEKHQTPMLNTRFMLGDPEHWLGVGQRNPSWEPFCLCLQAAGADRTGVSSVEEMWQYPLLHAVIEFDHESRDPFHKILSESNGDDLTRRDALGRTPLHVAIQTSAKSVDVDDGECDDEDDLNHMGDVIQRLLNDPQHGSPHAASLPTDDKGTLPLHYALKLGLDWDDGVCHIVNAFQGALAIPDPETHLIPCVLAASNGNSTVDIIFRLMIRRPNLIADLCRSIADYSTEWKEYTCK